MNLESDFLIKCLQVNGYAADKLEEALDGVKVVVIPAGVPRKVSVHMYSCKVMC